MGRLVVYLVQYRQETFPRGRANHRTKSHRKERAIRTASLCPARWKVFPFLKEKGYKIGLATSSPLALVKVVAKKLQINPYLQAIASAEELKYGKPHPQVYLNCAEALEVSPLECVCLEDSFNGMIAVKAARMKCIVIPARHQQHQSRWDAADIKLASLLDLNDQVLDEL